MENTTKRMIKVTGKAKIAVKPDTIRLVIALKGTRESYEGVLQLSSQQTEMLKNCFEQLGFERTDLKTTSFQVNTKYENYQDKGRAWKQKFVGYEFRHSLKIEFDVEYQMFGKMLYALAHSFAEPEFQIFYIVKDAEPVRNLLLAKAVEDAKVKAEVLAKAAGVTLGEVNTIDYSWEEMEIISKPRNRMMAAYNGGPEVDGAGACEIDMEPEDINVSDHVTVSWYIC